MSPPFGSVQAQSTYPQHASVEGTRRRTPSRGARPLLTLLAALLLAGCEDLRFPRDPDGTLDRVLATRSVTVAVTDHAPWVDVAGLPAPGGAEAELVRAFAETLGARVVWREMPGFAALEALDSGEADLAIGGFTRENVSTYGAGAPSYVYFEEALVVATRPKAHTPNDIKGAAVVVPPGVVAEALIRERGGIPVHDQAGSDLVAIPGWQAVDQGLVPTGVILQRRGYVMAIPKGENAWLMRLERFLRANAAGIDDRLREHAR